MKKQLRVMTYVLAALSAGVVEAKPAPVHQKRAPAKVETKKIAPTEQEKPVAKVAAPVAPQEKSEKVDISDLEKRYWAPKDKDYSVVQNRVYSKAGRVSISGSYGALINDTYSNGTQTAAAVNYYFNDYLGIELQYAKTQSTDNSVVAVAKSDTGIALDHNKQTGYYGASINWVPIYAKMSLLDKKIIYFDMAFSPGVGMTQYQQQVISGNGDTQSAFTMSLDVTQNFFLSNNFAFRLDVRNRFYNQSIKDFRSGVDRRTESQRSTTILVGLTYMF